MEIIKSFVFNLEALQVSVGISIIVFMYIIMKSNLTYVQLFRDFKKVTKTTSKSIIVFLLVLTGVNLFLPKSFLGFNISFIPYILTIVELGYLVYFLNKISHKYFKAYRKWVYLVPLMSWFTMNILPIITHSITMLTSLIK